MKLSQQIPVCCLKVLTLTLLLFQCHLVHSATKSEELTSYLESSPSIYSEKSPYARGTIVFANLNDDSKHLMVAKERLNTEENSDVLTISDWNSSDERRIVWRSDASHTQGVFLVGNIDEDPLDEIVIFDPNYLDGDKTRPPMMVVEWHEGKFRTTPYSEIVAFVGALIDINLDGIQEILLATPRSKSAIDAEHYTLGQPMTLQLFSMMNALNLVSEYELQDLDQFREPLYEAQALAVHDLTGDGYKEIIAIQNPTTYNAGVRLYVYTVSGTKPIERLHSESFFTHGRYLRNFKTGIRYIDTFDYNNNKYIFVESASGRWSTVVEWFESVNSSKVRLGVVDLTEINLLRVARNRTGVLDSEGYATERYITPDQQSVFVREKVQFETEE